MLPQLKTILFEEKTIFSELECFNISIDINKQEIKNRIETYKTNILRSDLMKSSLDFEEYLKSLNTVMEIKLSNVKEYSRLSELSNRTNKCTNGIRYSCEKLKQYISNLNYKLYTIKVYEKFGSVANNKN